MGHAKRRLRSGRWAGARSLGDRSNTDSRGQVLNFVKDKVFKTDPMPISRVKELLSRKRPQQRSGLTGEDFDRLGDATDIEVVAALAIKALSRRELHQSQNPASDERESTQEGLSWRRLQWSRRACSPSAAHLRQPVGSPARACQTFGPVICLRGTIDTPDRHRIQKLQHSAPRRSP
jgi:hypothetical protein